MYIVVKSVQCQSLLSVILSCSALARSSSRSKEVYVVSGGRKYKMLPDESDKSGTTYEYTFKKLQKELDFYFDAAGFSSKSYSVELLERPALLSFNAKIVFSNSFNND